MYCNWNNYKRTRDDFIYHGYFYLKLTNRAIWRNLFAWIQQLRIAT